MCRSSCHKYAHIAWLDGARNPQQKGPCALAVSPAKFTLKTGPQLPRSRRSLHRGASDDPDSHHRATQLAAIWIRGWSSRRGCGRVVRLLTRVQMSKSSRQRRQRVRRRSPPRWRSARRAPAHRSTPRRNVTCHQSTATGPTRTTGEQDLDEAYRVTEPFEPDEFVEPPYYYCALLSLRFCCTQCPKRFSTRQIRYCAI